MAVWTRPCGVFPCLRQMGRFSASSRNGMIKSSCSILKTHICTIALSLTLVNTVRLPREAFRYGPVQYLVAYSIWLLVVCLATSLLQLAIGQLSQQDSVGVWRAVPILRGVGHIQLITSYICCVYNLLYVALAAAYILWIGKDTFPLRMCTRLQITPNGYENKINASECFSSTFLSPIPHHPEYVGIMAIIIFFLWFFVPLLLYGLTKTYKIALSFLAPLTIIVAIILAIFLSKETSLQSILVSCRQWYVYTEPSLWFSSLIQAILSMQIANGYLISSGGTIYKFSDVRWISTSLISYNLIAGWLWVFLWQTIGGEDQKDTSFVSVLVLIYQSSMSEKRKKVWPLLAYLVIFLSGVITILTLLYPIYDRLQRVSGDKWKLFASIISALGTVLTLALLVKAVDANSILDELLVPALTIFTTTLQVVGFVFIYGYCMLRSDLKFLTGRKSSRVWLFFWIMIPIILVVFTGWWLRWLLRESFGDTQTLWPLGGAFIGILIVMSLVAAIAVAKEEQFNLLSKIASSFRPSRLWGPEDPTIRYNWMIQRYSNERLSNEEENSIDSYSNYPKEQQIQNPKYDWPQLSDSYQRPYGNYDSYPDYDDKVYTIYASPKTQKKNTEGKFNSPNVCIANDKLDSRLYCNCNRHFTLNVPYMKGETTTSL